MAVNNCIKYLLFFFNLLFWVSLLGLSWAGPPFAGQNQATAARLLLR